MQATAGENVVRGRLIVWWVIWFSLIAGLCVQYYFLAWPVDTDGPVEANTFDYFSLVPLAVSVVVRWFLLPNCTNMPVAFVAFIVGISLAEACGIFAIFLAAAFKDELFVLGVLGIAQFAPFYARRFATMRTS